MTDHSRNRDAAAIRGSMALPWRAFARAVGRLADFLLPPLCLACRGAVAGHGGLCAACWAGVDFIEPPVCERLGLPLP